MILSGFYLGLIRLICQKLHFYILRNIEMKFNIKKLYLHGKCYLHALKSLLNMHKVLNRPNVPSKLQKISILLLFLVITKSLYPSVRCLMSIASKKKQKLQIKRINVFWTRLKPIQPSKVRSYNFSTKFYYEHFLR